MPMTSGHVFRLVDAHNGARRIALAYIIIGLLWITGSDVLLRNVIGDKSIDAWAETLKGYGFVLTTGYLLYVAIAYLQSQHRNTQLRLSQSEQAYRAIFDSHPNALCVYAPDTLQILAANAVACRLFGYSREQLLAATLDTVCEPAARPDMHRLMRGDLLRNATPIRGGMRGRSRNGRSLQLDASISALEFDRRDARLLWLVDSSERQRNIDESLQAQRLLLEASRIVGLGYWALDQSGRVVAWSEQMTRIIGVDAASRPRREMALSAWVHDGDRAALSAALQNAWHGDSFCIEVRVVRVNGEIGYALLRGELLEGGGDKRLMGTALDISERKRSEQQLLASEQQYRQLIELMPLALLILRAEHIVFANPTAATMFGAARAAELCGRRILDLMASASQAAAGERMRMLIDNPGSVDLSFQERQLKKISGEIFSAEVAAQSLLIADERCIQVIVRDVSDQKKTQAELKVANERLLRLSTRAIETAEDERQQLSRELHDDIGQLLTFIKMSSSWIQKHPSHSEVGQRAELVNATAGEALQKVRNLALMLRPAQLDALGLKAAMAEHLRKFLGGHAIEYVLLGDELSPRPQPLIEMALFRIFQEALTNIIRHSGASHIEVEIEGGPALRLRIVDDGCGFDVPSALTAGGSIGLHTMTERAEQLGGTLAIHSVAGVGTEIITTIPTGEAGADARFRPYGGAGIMTRAKGEQR